MRPASLLSILALVPLVIGCTASPTAIASSKAATQLERTQVETSLPTPQPEPNQALSSPTASAQATIQTAATAMPPTPETSQPTRVAVAISTLDPQDWKKFPVIPVIGQAPLQIYQHGLQLGNNPHAFSNVGDCGSTPAWFLGDFDRGTKFYDLGAYQDLQGVIQQFKGAFERTSLAGRAGFNASSVFATIWSDRSQCQANEGPLACEYRVNRPSMAFIMLGSNDVWHPDTFEPQMRKIIEYSIQNGVIPILSTKADNDEGNESINATIAKLAVEYDIPLWNFWRAVQDLPDKGLQDDGVHLTWGPNRFSDPAVMKRAWPVRNLTALQTLDAVWRAVSGVAPSATITPAP
jgi:hypothetical protein